MVLDSFFEVLFAACDPPLTERAERQLQFPASDRADCANRFVKLNGELRMLTAGFFKRAVSPSLLLRTCRKRCLR